MPPRETIQQQYIRQVKESIANALNTLITAKNRDVKTSGTIGSVNGSIATAKEAMEKLRRSGMIRGEVRESLPLFEAEWRGGDCNGAANKKRWDRCIELLTDVNRYLQEVDQVV